MDQAEYKMEREKALRQQEQFLSENPEIRRLVMTKKIFLRFLIGYLIVHFGLTVCIRVQQGDFTGFTAAAEAVKLLFQMLWLCLFLNYAGNWKQNLMLFISALYNLAVLLQNSKLLREVVSYLPYMERSTGLMYGSTLLMEALIPFILAGMGFWLTVPRRNRELSEEAAAMYQETLQNLQR